jgi:hypothetical protein
MEPDEASCIRNRGHYRWTGVIVRHWSVYARSESEKSSGIVSLSQELILL